MATTIFPFGEGHTEAVVFEFLRQKWFSDVEFQEFVAVGGKGQFISRIQDQVRSELVPGREVRIIVFRDLDEGEDVQSITQSFQSIVHRLLADWDLQPNQRPIESNVYSWEEPTTQDHPGLRFVLHIADSRNSDLPVSLKNQTTDGYILALGLTQSVLERFAQEAQVSSDASKLHALITDAIPRVIRDVNIHFEEDKDYLAACLVASRFWVVKRTEDQARLVQIILERAWKYNRDGVAQVLQTWRAAIQEVSQ